MSILFRLVWVIIAAFFRRPLGFRGVSTLRQRVWPTDLDINIHMNNARYLAVMDLGRTDWIIRSGAWRLMHRERMSPIVGGCMVRYRRALQPFQRFTLRTRLLGWDERWLYVEQIMAGHDGIACLAVQRAGFTQRGKLVPPDELARLLNYDGPPIPAPPWVEGWNEAEGAFVHAAEGFRSR
jgi:acyl-CoA thioesterase FadM